MAATSFKLEGVIAICYLFNGSSALYLRNIIFLSKMLSAHLHRICTDSKVSKAKIGTKKD